MSSKNIYTCQHNSDLFIATNKTRGASQLGSIQKNIQMFFPGPGYLRGKYPAASQLLDETSDLSSQKTTSCSEMSAQEIEWLTN